MNNHNNYPWKNNINTPPNQTIHCAQSLKNKVILKNTQKLNMGFGSEKPWLWLTYLVEKTDRVRHCWGKKKQEEPFTELAITILFSLLTLLYQSLVGGCGGDCWQFDTEKEGEEGEMRISRSLKNNLINIIHSYFQVKILFFVIYLYIYIYVYHIFVKAFFFFLGLQLVKHPPLSLSSVPQTELYYWWLIVVPHHEFERESSDLWGPPLYSLHF